MLAGRSFSRKGPGQIPEYHRRVNIEDLKMLKGLMLPIVAPRQLPDNLSLERVVALPDHGVADGYELEFRAGEAELRLKAVSTQPEVPAKGSKRVAFETRYFGNCVVECSGKDVISNWFSEMQVGYPAYRVEARGLSPEEVIEFVNSLDYMRIN